MCTSKKGISAHQLHRELGVTYKTAWFMCHRIRLAMRDNGPLPFTGIVESDEAYIGGKPRKKQYHGGTYKRGTGTSKVPVHALVERGGRKRTRTMDTVKSGNLRRNITELVDKSAAIHTDENRMYRTATEGFADHRTVEHGIHEYARLDDDGVKVTINTAESAFALIKRGIYGTFHHVSKQHLQRYLDEFDFRWDDRKSDDSASPSSRPAGRRSRRLDL